MLRGSMPFSSLTSAVTFIFHCISYPILIVVIKNNLDDENYNLESNYSRKVLSWYQLKLLHFSQIIYKIVSYVQDFVPFKFFFF